MSKNWLDCLVEQHKELESPLSFWLWGGLAAISAVVKDQVWINRHLYNLYPNVYIMLHAESGLKKGPPIAMAKKLVQAVGNTRVISGRSSIQGILKRLGTAQTQPGGKVQADSAAFICSSELSSSIVEDKVATTILTDLYDRQYNAGEWQSLLKMETFELKNPTISMFTATNEAHSSDFFAKKDIQGGYFARTFIIHEISPNRDNSLLVPLENEINYTDSAQYLKQLAKLTGPFAPMGSRVASDECPIFWENPDTGEGWFYSPSGILYEKWYYDFKQASRAQLVKDETGTLNRFGDSVLKVAMLLSLAKNPILEIDEESMARAIEYCERLIGSVRQTTLGAKGLSSSAALKSKVITELVGRDNHSISRIVLMKKMWMHFNSHTEFDELMVGFEQSGLIQIEQMGNQIIYRMPERVAKEWLEFFAGKMNV